MPSQFTGVEEITGPSPMHGARECMAMPSAAARRAAIDAAILPRRRDRWRTPVPAVVTVAFSLVPISNALG